MNKLLIALLFSAFSVFGAQNWNGYKDTTAFDTTLANGEISYGKAAELSDGENVRWIICVNDTDANGFANDSVNLEWGFQTGTGIFDSAGNRDTMWTNLITVDTIVTASYGALTAGSVDSSGAIAVPWSKEADTTEITGYAVQSRWIVPQWDVLYRPYLKGITGNNQGSNLDVLFFEVRREYIQTRNK